MVQKEEVINMVKFVQNIEEVKNLYNRQEVESIVDVFQRKSVLETKFKKRENYVNLHLF